MSTPDSIGLDNSPVYERALLPLDEAELAVKDIVHAAPTWREVRITISPIASYRFEFYRGWNPPEGPEMYRRLEMRSNILQTKTPSNFTLGRCDKADPNYSIGLAIAEFRPLGQVDGSFIFTGIIEGLMCGDSIDYRYLYDNVLGGTIKIEIYQSQ